LGAKPPSCCQALHLSEDEAGLRITVARLSRRFPQVLAMLDDGRIHLTGLRLLARHLTADNVDAVLAEAAGCSRAEIELLVARLAPEVVKGPAWKLRPVVAKATAPAAQRARRRAGSWRSGRLPVRNR